MLSNSLLYFSDDEEKYNLEIKIINCMKSRVNTRYINVITPFVESTNNNYGFLIMSINCILIELFYQLKHGLNRTDSMKKATIKDAFREVIPELDNSFYKKTGEQFYTEIRCKLIHQAQTESNVALSMTTTSLITTTEHEGYTVYNPILFFNDIVLLYSTIFDPYEYENNSLLRRNIVNKVKQIAFKMDLKKIKDLEDL